MVTELFPLRLTFQRLSDEDKEDIEMDAPDADEEGDEDEDDGQLGGGDDDNESSSSIEE